MQKCLPATPALTLTQPYTMGNFQQIIQTDIDHSSLEDLHFSLIHISAFHTSHLVVANSICRYIDLFSTKHNIPFLVYQVFDIPFKLPTHKNPTLTQTTKCHFFQKKVPNLLQNSSTVIVQCSHLISWHIDKYSLSRFNSDSFIDIVHCVYQCNNNNCLRMVNPSMKIDEYYGTSTIISSTYNNRRRVYFIQDNVTYSI